MLRKLLLLLLIGFAFTEINAQSAFVVHMPDCVTPTYTVEFEDVGPNALDGTKRDYASVNPATGVFDGLFVPDIPITAPAVDTSNWDVTWDGSQWTVNNTGGGLAYTNSATSSTPPGSGWVAAGGCSGTDEPIFRDNTGVLPVNREDFSNIKIYPNPSTGFINISNLKENSRVVISNITGQIVKDVMVGVNDNRIDIQDLSQGFYFVELEGKKTIKLLKR